MWSPCTDIAEGEDFRNLAKWHNSKVMQNRSISIFLSGDVLENKQFYRIHFHAHPDHSLCLYGVYLHAIKSETTR